MQRRRPRWPRLRKGLRQSRRKTKNYSMNSKHNGAVEKTRTSTAFRPQRPQRCASTSSATTAHHDGPAGPAPGRSGRLAKLFGRCKRAVRFYFAAGAKAHCRAFGRCHRTDSKESSICHRSGVRPSSNHPSGGGTGGEAALILRSPVVFHSARRGAHRERRISWRLSHAFV